MYRTAPGPVLALLGTLLLGCRADRPEPVTRDAVADSAAAPAIAAQARAWLDSVRSGEAELLQASGGRAARSRWDRLAITSRTGAQQLFHDDVRAGELVRLHVYRGFIEVIGQHVVEVIFVPEGGQFLLTDGSAGGQWEVDGPPVPSPDGARFITTSLDLVAGHRPNRMRIYRVDGGRPVLEWEVTPRDWGGAAPLWLDSGAVRIDRTIVDRSTTPFTLRSSPMLIERDGGVWRIVP